MRESNHEGQSVQLTDTAEFPETSWSLVLRAGEGSEETRFEALSQFCTIYWFPLYAYARRSGRTVEDAEDLTQSFFSKLLKRETTAHLEQVRGKLRTYLLAAMKHHIASDWRHQHAQKRGGHALHESIDLEQAEHRYQNEPFHNDSPDRVYERQWALSVMRRGMDRLREEYANSNRGEVYEGLQPYLDGKSKHFDAIAVGSRLSMTDSAVRVALHRMRRRLREHIEREVAETIGSHEDVAEEMRCLFEAISSGCAATIAPFG